MSSEYLLRIEASYPQTPCEDLIQAELHDFFTSIPAYGIHSEIVKGREYIYWKGQCDGSYFSEASQVRLLQEIQKSLFESLGIENDTEKQAMLKLRIYLIDLEDWGSPIGDKTL